VSRGSVSGHGKYRKLYSAHFGCRVDAGFQVIEGEAFHPQPLQRQRVGIGQGHQLARGFRRVHELAGHGRPPTTRWRASHQISAIAPLQGQGDAFSDLQMAGGPAGFLITIRKTARRFIIRLFGQIETLQVPFQVFGSVVASLADRAVALVAASGLSALIRHEKSTRVDPVRRRFGVRCASRLGGGS
jgi:hypothetical protein